MGHGGSTEAGAGAGGWRWRKSHLPACPSGRLMWRRFFKIRQVVGCAGGLLYGNMGFCNMYDKREAGARRGLYKGTREEVVGG